MFQSIFAKKLTQVVSVPVMVTAASVALLTACSDDDDDNNSPAADVTLSQVQENYVDMAYAAYSDSLTTAEALKAAVDVFLAAPTEANLTAARVAYKAARKPYQQSEIMRWDETIAGDTDLTADGEGPASVDAWEGQVNAWPLDENRIDSIINGDGAITKQALIDANGLEEDGTTENEANVTTGVHAIEYMLWDRDDNARGPGSRAADEFSSDTDCAGDAATAECRSSQYLRVATELLVDDLTDMTAEWAPAAEQTQGTLAYNFLNSDKALGYMIQSIASMSVGELAGARLAAGLWRKDAPNPGDFKEGDYEEEHDCFSDLSHVAVYYNFVGVKNAFSGSYEKLNGDMVKGASFGQYLKQLDEGLYTELKTQLDKADVQMKIVFDAGERATNPRSFDQIIADSEATYENSAAKTAELIAVETAITDLAQVELVILDINDAFTLAGFDPDGIGETD
ncbi:Uncharacterised protein [BD1-7 clade bacterium]|uniref:Imelysin-like domain-containing protein n=1 Tax=BD1-7 clade bacterium TaxID=2029982 RepID=A0A5S9PTX0_9GAMM|nr:Uncharacterised protein [BD1-7 clade bacterium]